MYIPRMHILLSLYNTHTPIMFARFFPLDNARHDRLNVGIISLFVCYLFALTGMDTVEAPLLATCDKPECPICLSQFTEPNQIMFCGHIICRPCLVTYGCSHVRGVEAGCPPPTSPHATCSARQEAGTSDRREAETLNKLSSNRLMCS